LMRCRGGETVLMKAPALGLRTKFILIVLAILAMAIGASSLYLAAHQKDLGTQKLEAKTQALGRFAALIAPQAILSYDFLALDTYVREIVSQEDFVLAVFFDHAGNALTERLSLPQDLSLSFTEKPEAALQRLQANPRFMRWDFPMQHDGRDLGQLSLLLDMSHLDRESQALLWQQFRVYGFVSLMLAFALILSFQVQILKPIQSLVAAVQRVAKGDFQTSVHVKGQDEMSRLALGFNMMMQEIATHQAKLKVLSSAVEHSPAPILITNIQGEIDYVNPKFEDVTGYRYDEIVGQKHAVLRSNYTKDDRYDQLWQAVTSGKEWQGELLHRRKNGELFWARVWIAPVFRDDGTMAHLVAIKEDITEHKEKREAMEIMLDEYARSNAALERFAYVTSHDLQEPVRSILSFSQLLDRRYRENLAPEAKDYLDYITQGAHRISDLVQALLDYGHIASSTKPFAPVSVKDIGMAAQAALHKAILDTKADICWEGDEIIQGDKDQLILLFQNILRNALTFVVPEVTPKIRITLKKDLPFIQIAIQDNGIGIEPLYQERIFEIFQRLHNQEVFPGKGIGLAVCKRIVERHGGKIWVEKAAGQGTVFVFTLPAGLNR